MLKAMMLAPIRWYQRYLSPLKRAPSCRYLPTCSEYAAEAIRTRGALIGGLKALWRILRCNPLFKGGYDPVDGCRHEHARIEGRRPAPGDSEPAPEAR